MSSVCLGCDTGITSSDHNATNICSACQLDDVNEQLRSAEEVIKTLAEEGRDGMKALNLAIDYLTKYE